MWAVRGPLWIVSTKSIIFKFKLGPIFFHTLTRTKLAIVFSLAILLTTIATIDLDQASYGLQLKDSETQCREGQVLVFRAISNNYVCVFEYTAERWVELGIAEMVEQEVQEESMKNEVQEDSMQEQNVVYDDGIFQLVQVAENVYSFGNPMASFSLVLVTDEGVIVGDPVNKNHSEVMLKAIRTVTDQPIKYLIYSHNHWDHTGGGQVLKNEGAIILSHIDARDWLLENPNQNVVVADEVWEGNLKEIILGNKTLELHHFGPSHGEGMTVFYLPEEKIIFIVDIVTPKRLAFTIMPDFSPMEWERTLIEVEKLDFDTAMFGHKRALGPALEVKEVREYLQDLRAEIFSMMQEGVNPFMIPSTLELPKYQDWEFYDEWLEMNAWRIFLEPHMGW